MTLLRELMLVIILLFIVLFTANFILTVFNSRLYLENQLQSHADDTASSLGLSMTTALQEKDVAHLDVLANAILIEVTIRALHLKVSGERLSWRKVISLPSMMSQHGFYLWSRFQAPQDNPKSCQDGANLAFSQSSAIPDMPIEIYGV